MDFKIGYNVKPKEVNNQNIVIFEEYQFVSGRYDLVEVLPTADECNAYGFIYKNSDTRCYVKDEAAFFNPPSPRDNLIVARANNNIGFNTRDNIISGIEHTLTGNNYSNIISGDNHTINNLVSNSNVSGTKGEVVYHNSKVLGGNNDTDILGERQAVQVMAAAATTDATPTISYLNNDGATMIKVPENTIISFSADVVVVRTGGVGSGNKGDFRKWHEEGAVVNIGGTLTIQRIKTLKVSSGTVSGWSIEAKTTGEFLYLEVVGRNNRDLKWAIQWNLTEIKTGVDLSA